MAALDVEDFVHLEGPFAEPAHAWSAARALIDSATPGANPLEVIGEFVIPPAEGPPSRDFQTLHFDFGLPLAPSAPGDIARFTALHVAAGTAPSEATTRLVPLRTLFAGRPWPEGEELVRRFHAYGKSHGAWEASEGYVEGSLARVIEAVLDRSPVLPSVREQPDFLCGMEFASLFDEQRFFTERGLDTDAATIEVRLEPGELLVFDNLALAHGRRGMRRPGELMQRVFGHRRLTVAGQLRLRELVLAAFAATS